VRIHPGRLRDGLSRMGGGGGRRARGDPSRESCVSRGRRSRGNPPGDDAVPARVVAERFAPDGAVGGRSPCVLRSAEKDRSRSRSRYTRFMRRRAVGERGITLVEIAAAVTIVGILVALLLPAWVCSSRFQKVLACEGHLHALYEAQVKAPAPGSKQLGSGYWARL